MAKTSSLVIGFFFVVLAVLQSVYADNNGTEICLRIDSSPYSYVCDPRQIGCKVDFGNVSSCDMCHPICFRSSFSISTCDNSTNTGSYNCKCCIPFSPPSGPSGTAATTTSLAFLSFSLILGLMLSRLFI
ncbi:hypothetical protein MKW94_012473 [Papaver nudicaule]|uniref:Uncharacterized protein n=1 Tax=Papaver nudicaule TaxID=74823 RepID=A0AA41V2W1_PAPNU|nr:hypothetical protein [Papaver nudicaule]